MDCIVDNPKLYNDKIQDAYGIYTETALWTSVITIGVLIVTLLVNVFGTRNNFLILVTLLLILSNCADIVTTQICSGKTGQNVFIAFSAGIRDITYNAGIWLYSFKYWVISLQMHKLIVKQDLNEYDMTNDRIFNIVMIILIVLCGAAYSVIYFIELQSNQVSREYSIWIAEIIMLSINYLFVLASSFVLSIAIWRIRETINKSKMLE